MVINALINVASSDTKNAIACAMSMGAPTRPTGYWSSKNSSSFGFYGNHTSDGQVRPRHKQIEDTEVANQRPPAVGVALTEFH